MHFFTVRKIPVGKDVNHRLICKECFVKIKSVFFETASIHDAELSTDWRPFKRSRLTAIVKACPYEKSHNVRTNIDLLKTVTICIAPRSGFTVVTVDNILAVVGLVNTASLKSTVVFTAQHRHIGVLFSEVVISMGDIVKAGHIKNIASTAVRCDTRIHSTQ